MLKKIYSSRLYKWIVSLLCLWFFLYPKPYEVFFIILLSIPLPTIWIDGLRRCSFVSWHEFKQGNNRYAFLFNNVFNLAGWVVTFRVLLDFDLENGTIIYYPIGILIAIFLLYLISLLEIKNSYWKRLRKSVLLLMGILNATLYLITAVYGINCIFDNSEPISYNVEKLGMYRSTKGGRYIKLAPWGNIEHEKKVMVSRNLFDSYGGKKFIEVNYKKGFLNIPWYYLTGNEPMGLDSLFWKKLTLN